MSRPWIVGLCAALVVATFGFAPTAFGQANKPNVDVFEMLEMEIDTKDFTEAMPLKQILQLFYEKYQAKGLEVRIVVDIAAFRQEDNSQRDGPNEDEVKLPCVPKQIALSQALRLVVGQFKNSNGTFIIRNGGIFITTKKQASLPARLREPIVARFNRVPIVEVLQRLSDMTGATILLDPRVNERMQTPVTAEFRGDTTLEAALPALADMVGLTVVRMERCVYLTTPAAAETMGRFLREQREEGYKERERKQKLKQQS